MVGPSKRASRRSVGRLVPLLIAAFGLLVASATGSAQTKNGFDLSNALIPADEILRGGPPRDGIPALTNPRFEPVEEAGWMNPDDRLMALERGGVAKAYPLRIITWHEIVNDEVGGEPVAVTYCPLCGTGMAFDPVVDGRRLEFGVSGLLYNSDVLMYDRGTESLWSQIRRQAVTGPMRGERLEMIPLTHTTWERWAREHPDGLVLSRRTGHDRDYSRDPYLQYASSPGTMFPVAHEDDRLPEKAMVLGIEGENGAKAFPLDALGEVPRPVRAEVGDREVFVYWFADSWTAFATTLDGERIPATLAFWFAWSAFYPETEVWSAE
ncbi:MAG: DUF3179 domain-containing protein [Gemmatimonadota bacterium]|nr:DUF3179 domain-containing protein [Gemmatimonadota bacterium]